AGCYDLFDSIRRIRLSQRDLDGGSLCIGFGRPPARDTGQRGRAGSNCVGDGKYGPGFGDTRTGSILWLRSHSNGRGHQSDSAEIKYWFWVVSILSARRVDYHPDLHSDSDLDADVSFHSYSDTDSDSDHNDHTDPIRRDDRDS